MNNRIVNIVLTELGSDKLKFDIFLFQHQSKCSKRLFSGVISSPRYVSNTKYNKEHVKSEYN